MTGHCSASRAGLFFWASLPVAVALIVLPAALRAQAQRDPTIAPASVGSPSVPGAERAQNADPGAMTVIVRDGHPYLVVGTRLYAVGQKLGEARIERISETEIWLREGPVVRKLARFSGIQRRLAAPPDCALPAKKPRPAKTPGWSGAARPADNCARIQP